MTDTRLVPLAAALWLATVLVPSLPASWHPVFVAATTVPAVAALFVTGRAPWLSLLLFGLAAGCAISGLHVRATHDGPVGALAADGAVARVDLEVRSDPRLRGRAEERRYVMFDAELRVVRARGTRQRVHARVLVTASPAWQRVVPGERVRTVVRLAATERGDDRAAFVSARAPPRIVAEPGTVDRLVNQVRARFREAVRPLPVVERALLPSLVVGDTTRLPPWLVDDLRAAGLTHLTAVSGANLTILLGCVLAMARLAGIRGWGVAIAGVLVVAGFVLVCRPEPSVIRAAAMGVVGLAGLVTGHRRTGVPSLAIAVIVLLLVDPWLGRSYGFALSVFATAGILVFAPGWTAILERRAPRWLAVGLAVPLAAQVAVTPLLVTLDGEISVVALVANLLTGPVVPMATVSGFATLMLGIGLPAVAQVAAWAAYPAVWWIVQVAQHAASLPGATVSWEAGPWRLVLLIVGCLALAGGVAMLLRRTRLLLVFGIVLVLWLVRPIPLDGARWLTGWPPANWVVAACDVGQGDALVLNSGSGRGVLVDTGPEPREVDECLRSLGIRRLELVVLTHFHRDHTGGLSGALDGRSVDRLWTRPGAEPVKALRPGLGRGGQLDRIRVEQPVSGHRLRVGAGLVTVLAPEEPFAGPSPGAGAEGEGSAENDASLVLLAEVAGVRVLLTGDIEPAGQRRLLGWGEALDVDVLKVPHHGARYQSPIFLDRTSPRLALISVGADNDYGHPAASTLSYFASRGIPVARTDRDGTVLLTVAGDRLGLVRRAGRIRRTPGVASGCRRCVGC